MEKSLKLPLSKEVGTQEKYGISGEVFIVDADGEQIFKGEGFCYEGMLADQIIAACNAHDHLVQALSLAKVALEQSEAKGRFYIEPINRHNDALKAVNEALTAAGAT